MEALESFLDERIALLVTSAGLTPAETDIVRMAALDDMRASDMARSMSLSINTVKRHVKNLLRKTGHKRLSDLTIMLLREVITHEAKAHDAARAHGSTEPRER